MSTSTMHEILGAAAPWEYDFAADQRFAMIAAMRYVPQPVRYHPEGDVLNHTVETLRAVCGSTTDFGARLAALLHDIGKTATDRSSWPHHYDHDKLGVELAVRFMDQFSDIPQEDRDFVLMTVRCHMAVKHWTEFRQGTRQRYVATIGRENMWRFAAVVAADHTDPDEIRAMVNDS